MQSAWEAAIIYVCPIGQAQEEGIMKKVHTAFNRLVLDTKDLSMFPIKRVVTESEKYWEVTDLRKGKNYVRKYRTKFNAELAICSLVAIAIGDGLGSEVK